MSRVFSVLITPAEPGNVVFHLLANEVEMFDRHTLIVDGIEIRVKDRIEDVIEEELDEEGYRLD